MESMPKSLLVLSHLSPFCGLYGEGGGERDLFHNSSTKYILTFFFLIEGKFFRVCKTVKKHFSLCPACHFDPVFHSRFEGIPVSILCCFPIFFSLT